MISRREVPLEWTTRRLPQSSNTEVNPVEDGPRLFCRLINAKSPQRGI